MNNIDKLLSDIADDAVLAYLRDGIDPDFVYERPDVEDFSETVQEAIYDKAVGALSALAEFFERTIQ